MYLTHHAIEVVAQLLDTYLLAGGQLALPQGGGWGVGKEPWLRTEEPQESHLALCLLPSEPCSPAGASGGLGMLPIPPSPSLEWWAGLAALVYRLWGLRVC